MSAAKLLKKHQLNMCIILKNGKHRTFNIFTSLLLVAVLLTLPSYSRSATPDEGKKWTIVIDAGHGGKDPGALGSYSKEANITLAIALQTGAYIEKNISNARVLYTRTTDVLPGLKERAEFANKNKADLFISIHANWAQSKTIKGTETFVMGLAKDKQNLEVAMKENEVILLEEDFSTKYEGFDPKSPESYIIFTLMQNVYQEQSTKLASMIQNQFRTRVNRVDRGVKQEVFWVLYMTTMPSVLVETGFITSPEEEKYLNSKEGQEYIASAIFRACRDYITDVGSKSGISPAPEVARTEGTKQQAEVPKNTGDITFMVQVATSIEKTEIKADNFKGISEITEIQSPDRYRYASGRFSNYDDAVQHRKKVESLFPDAFIIAVKEDKILPLQDALQLQKQ